MTVGKSPSRKRAVVTVATGPAASAVGSSKGKGAWRAAPVEAATAASGAVGGAKHAADAAGQQARPRHKLVRDSFTIPKSEYAVLESLKFRAAKLGRPIKKSEALRAGVAALHAMSDAAFLDALAAVPSIKTGRPKGMPAAKVESPAG